MYMYDDDFDRHAKIMASNSDDDDEFNDEDEDEYDGFHEEDEFDDDKFIEESYRTTFETNPEDLDIQAEDITDDSF